MLVYHNCESHRLKVEFLNYISQPPLQICNLVSTNKMHSSKALIWKWHEEAGCAEVIRFAGMGGSRKSVSEANQTN